MSSKLRQTTAQLYSSISELDNSLLEEVEQTSQQIKSYPIYYVDTPGTVADIASTIDYFYENKAKGKKFVIILDHTLLVEGQNRESALQVISDLQKLFIRVKKFPDTTIIQLSQMNRNIENPERINNPSYFKVIVFPHFVNTPFQINVWLLLKSLYVVTLLFKMLLFYFIFH